MVSSGTTTLNSDSDVTATDWSHIIPLLKEPHEFTDFSYVTLKKPVTIDFYKKWLDANHHGEMSYLKTHLPLKENPQLIQPKMRTAITLTQHYFPVQHPWECPPQARTALYAQNLDYHHWLKEHLNKAINSLQQKFPDEIFIPFVDSGPVLERDLAHQSGLGWFGKNTCLIHPKKGSLFFIAEILTSLTIEENNQVVKIQPDLCGKCTRCIDICPTKALTKHNLDARLCISYHTIESRQVPPKSLRPQIGDWFFGCDLCQTVCPWNQKVFKVQKEQSPEVFSTDLLLLLSPDQKTKLIDFFRDLLKSSGKQIQKKFRSTPYARAGNFGLKRNALIVIGNRKIIELHDEVQNLTTDPKLSELAQWTLDQLKM